MRWDPIGDIKKAADKVVSDVSNGVNQAVSTTLNSINRDASNLGNNINKGLAGATKNVERNFQKVSKGWAMALSGNFNNFDRTLLDTIGIVQTGGLSTLVNPDDVDNATGKESAIDRVEKEAVQAAQDQADAAAAAAAAEDWRSLTETISGQVGARLRAPGRSATLLGGGMGNTARNTLLTIRSN